MGWTETSHYFDTRAEKDSFVRSLFGEENIRYMTRDGTVYYLAVQQGEDVKAYVVQTYQKYVNLAHGSPMRAFGYRTDCETVCPTHHDAPYALLSKLTLPFNSHAEKWRSLCRRTQNNRKLLRTAPAGTKLQLVDKAAGTIILIRDKGRRLWVNEAHTLSYPISLLARQELVFIYPHSPERHR